MAKDAKSKALKKLKGDARELKSLSFERPKFGKRKLSDNEEFSKNFEKNYGKKAQAKVWGNTLKHHSSLIRDFPSGSDR